MAGILRLATESDAAGILAVYAPYVRDTAISFELEPPDLAEMRARIAKTTVRHPWLVCELDGAIAGYAYASRFHPRAAFAWTVETSVYVAPTAHRRGVARGLYTALFALLHAQGICTAIAAISLPNPPSVGLHEGMGFHAARLHEGVGFKHGAWHGVGYWQREVAPRPAAPALPLGIGELAGTPALTEALASGAALLRAQAPAMG